MKLGIVGAGAIVNDLLGCIHQCKCELTAICATARSEERLKRMVAEHGFKKYYTDYDEMLKDESIDTVYVAVPNYLHYRYGLKALNAGKNVIMEKPFTSNGRQAERLAELADEKGLILIEAITTLYLPTYKQIKDKVSEIGELRILTLNFTQYSSKYDDFKKGVIKPAFDVRQSGGSLMDLNIYNIHFVVDMFGMPLKVNYLPNMDRRVDTSGILTLNYPDFQAVLIGAKDCAAPYISALQGDEGCITLEGPCNSLNAFKFKRNGEEEVEFKRDDVHRMKYEFDKFVKVVDNKDTRFARRMMKETLRVMNVVDEAKKSAGIIFEDDRVI